MQLTDQQIDILKRNGCSSDDWSSIMVTEDFSPDNIRNVKITDCSIGANVYINNVFGELRNIFISSGVHIEAVYSITCSPDTTYGVGYKVNVMSENGGRPVTLYPSLSANVAYLQAFYRHSALLSKALDEQIADEVESATGSTCVIGRDVKIVNCGVLADLSIADGASLHGVSRLSKATIGRAEIGENVIAENLIVSDGAVVTDGAHIKGSFIGECVTVSAATIHDSLIFANSHIENGEVVASFLGPFSTSMHKSTLLIGGLFSFFNAGSGSNQSNHGYKLGPMHQGITQRGCKTGSDSYILWPAAIGAFTTILGRHYGHPDTRNFPFSLLLNDSEGRSILLPGAAAATVGLARDVDKWPRRDRREEVAVPSTFTFNDITNFQWLSPFTIEACLRGINCLKASRRDMFDGFVIPEKAVEKGIKIYKLLINRYIAETLLTKIQSLISVNPQFGVNEIIESLKFISSEDGHGHWVDIAGLLAPKMAVENLIKQLVNGDYQDLDLFAYEGLANLFQNYNRLNWNWLQANLPRLLSCLPVQEETSGSSCSPVENNPTSSSVEDIFTSESVAGMLDRGAEAVEELTRLWEADAAKEFDPEKSSLGFGIDAYENRQEILDDFARTRGSLNGNKFLAMNQRATKEKSARMRMFAQVMRQSK